MRHWIGVASGEHVAVGVAGGFCQLGHGKKAPLRRLSPGDTIAFYSPKRSMSATEPLRAFTATGIVLDGEPYEVAMTPTFTPFRRDIGWEASGAVAIRGLLDQMHLTAGRTNWAAPFRFGLVEIDAHDHEIIRKAFDEQ